MQTQRRTNMTELIVAYRSFAKSDIYLKDTGTIITHTPAQSTRLLSSALFWALARRVVVITYRRLGITYRSHLEVLTFENGTKRLSQNVGKELTLYAK